MLRRPKFDLSRLMDMYSEKSAPAKAFQKKEAADDGPKNLLKQEAEKS